MYSSNREDELVMKHFGSTKGRFLDLGALDGRIGNNCLLFAEAGWDGVSVEVSYRNLAEWIERYRVFPKVKLVHAAIGTRRGLTTFWDTADQSLGTCSKRLQDRGCGRELGVYEMTVAAFTFDDLRSHFHGPFDYISIDLEDWTIPVLEEIPLDSIECRALCVEYFHKSVFGEDEPERIRDILERYKFKELAKTAENLVFVR